MFVIYCIFLSCPASTSFVAISGTIPLHNLNLQIVVVVVKSFPSAIIDLQRGFA